MPHIIRVRKDIMDSRPIRVYQGSKSFRYRWKMMALLSLNDNGQYVLPFSQRLVHIDRPLWPRSNPTRAPPGYEECGCIGCENKTYADHILKDDDDDDDGGDDDDEDDKSESGNYHLEEVYVESDDEESHDMEQESEKHKDLTSDLQVDVVSSSSTSDDSDINGGTDTVVTSDTNNNSLHDSCTQPMSVSPSLSPCPSDSYQSCD